MATVVGMMSNEDNELCYVFKDNETKERSLFDARDIEEWEVIRMG